MELHLKIQKYATEICDKKLLSVLSAGDLVAQEGKYHSVCLTGFMNRCRPIVKEDSINEYMCEAMAFADLCSFIQCKLEDENKDFIFKMGDLTKMYRERLSQLTGTPIEKQETHTTRLRRKIIANFPQLHPEKTGKEYFLIPDKADLAGQSIPEDCDADALAFFRFAKKLRTIIKRETVKFRGEFSEDNGEASVPSALLAVVKTILYGTSTVDNKCKATNPALSIAQLMIFNYHEKSPQGNFVRNNKNYEPPLPVYLALSEYGRSRSSEAINEMHNFGLSISYNRLTEITAALCNMVVKRSQEEGILCPGHLRRGIFTVGAYDNLDHNPSSVTSEGSFHGTTISVFQTPTAENQGEIRSFLTKFSDCDNGNRKAPSLPDNYGIVNVAVLPKKEPDYPTFSTQLIDLMIRSGLPINDWRGETDWLEHVHHHISSSTPTPNLSWAAFHAGKEIEAQIQIQSAVNSLLPLFYERSDSVAMVRHGMDIIKGITKFLNEDQVPVMCVDQPLYATAKLIQWNWPNVYGETKFFVMFAPFHVEQAFLRLIGQFLEGAGWTGIVTNSGIIATSAAVEAIIKVSHVVKARNAHQITAAVLYGLLQEAYIAGKDDESSFHTWIEKNSEISPTFYFWLMVLNLEVLLLTMVRSLRSASYPLYEESLRRMVPWFFIFDHHNYARWLTVYIRDLAELEKNAPSIHTQFNKGNFVIHKTSRAFSAIATDQAHEQNNAVVKGKGGAIGLTQDPNAFNRWSLSSPELNRLLNEFLGEDHDADESSHHEMYASFQERFHDKCLKLRESFLEFGNPFLEIGPELIAIDTRVIVGDSGVATLRSLHENSIRLYETFINERLVSKSKSLFSPIQKNNTKIFAVPKKRSAKKDVVVKNLKLDLQLFSRLFITVRNRELDLDTFFKYENQPFPPSLSQDGDLRTGQKADLLKVLENCIESCPIPESCEGIVYDGAAVVHSVVPRVSKTFQEYSNLEFNPHLKSLACNLKMKRVDVVWDNYSENSLKDTTRDARGTGLRRQVVATRAIPTNWPDFLRNSENKNELFRFLGHRLLESFLSFQVVTNIGYKIMSSTGSETQLDNVDCPTAMEEADGRIILHVKDMVQNGAQDVVVRTVDTDVVVLAISYFLTLSSLGLRRLWVLFGMGKHMRYIPAHQIAIILGEDRSVALRGFHSFTGCDTVSFFNTKGKKSAWNVWQSFQEATEAFKIIGNPNAVSTQAFEILERFVVLLYDRHSELCTVNAARKELFSSKCKELQVIPPTSEALHQHILRAAYQAGQIWGQVCNINATVPSPEEWGWRIVSDSWRPLWSKLPDLWNACVELTKCNCSKGCTFTSRCSCINANIPCTLQCPKCKGSCSNAGRRLI